MLNVLPSLASNLLLWREGETDSQSQGGREARISNSGSDFTNWDWQLGNLWFRAENLVGRIPALYGSITLLHNSFPRNTYSYLTLHVRIKLCLNYRKILPLVHIYFSPNGGIVKFIKARTRRDRGQKVENYYKHFWQSRTVWVRIR